MDGNIFAIGERDFAFRYSVFAIRQSVFALLSVAGSGPRPESTLLLLSGKVFLLPGRIFLLQEKTE